MEGLSDATLVGDVNGVSLASKLGEKVGAADGDDDG